MIKGSSLKKKDVIFLLSALTIPILQFIVFYIIVNFNSLAMTFQKTLDGVHYEPNGFNTIADAVKLFFTDESYKLIIKNTFVQYFCAQIVVPIIALFFSYCIWKKVWGYQFFSAILFIPSVISQLVFVMIAQTAVDSILPALFDNPEIVETFNPYTTGFMTATIFHCFLSFGGQLILQLGAMSGIDQSVVEYGQLDGVNPWQEFRYIVFPHIWPTIISLFTIGVASIFTNQGMLFSFFGSGAPAQVKTFGTHIYITVLTKRFAEYPIISALGTMLSVIVVAISNLAKHFMEKYGPNEE